MAPKILQIVPMGSISSALLRDLEEPLISQLGVASVVAKKPLNPPTYAFNKDRNQYHSIAIMRRLQPLLDPQNSFLLGVVEVDLFIPDAAFILGDADRETKVALMSILRLKEGGKLEVLKRRAQIEAVHQTGHLIGLSNCDDPRCVMFPAQTLAEADKRAVVLCSICRNEMAKIR